MNPWTLLLTTLGAILLGLGIVMVYTADEITDIMAVVTGGVLAVMGVIVLTGAGAAAAIIHQLKHPYR